MTRRGKPSLANETEYVRVGPGGVAMPEWLKSALIVAAIALAGWLFTQEFDTESRLSRIEATQQSHEKKDAEQDRRLDNFSDKLLSLPGRVRE